ncbi:protein CASC3 isoform X2 [Gouania willdenowi]|uniref:protein CASC3 isoform X2 n=1 Tax=Gouania willdenowi TaxID=441366 RepID=UPI0010561247|nr:protein CASC3 isoform X2 [Gouania willdenowi]
MADRRRRRRRVHLDSEDSQSGSEGSESGTQSGSDKARTGGSVPKARSREPEPVEENRQTEARSGQSECESEDGVGEAVLSDYDSADAEAEENLSHSEAADEDDDEEAPPPPPPVESAAEKVLTQQNQSRAEDKVGGAGERQSGDGQESTDDPETKAGVKQHLDDDEDRKNPAYIPRKGLFFEHDLRGHATEEERPKGRNRKLWKDEGRWEHDRFREEEQAPKSREELISIYGYDIRHNDRGRGRGRGRRSRDGGQRSWVSEGHVTTAPSPRTRPLPLPPQQRSSQSQAPLSSEAEGRGRAAVTTVTAQQRPASPAASEPAPQPAQKTSNQDAERPLERKSYSAARRTRAKASTDEPAGSVSVGGLDQEVVRLSLSGRSWRQSPASYIESDLRGLPSAPPPQFPPMEEMVGGASTRAKRYSSQRQRAGPEQAPPTMTLGVMESHYYEPVSYQTPLYTHSDGPAPLPPQSMLVQPEMHLPHPGLHPHQSAGGPITNPALYGAPPVSLSPGQPQPLLPPPFYPPPGVMTFPYTAVYNTPVQGQSQVTYGGVTYYDTVQQQAQPKPSPPRRTSQPVTVKPPPPEVHR